MIGEEYSDGLMIGEEYSEQGKLSLISTMASTLLKYEIHLLISHGVGNVWQV